MVFSLVFCWAAHHCFSTRITGVLSVRGLSLLEPNFVQMWCGHSSTATSGVTCCRNRCFLVVFALGPMARRCPFRSQSLHLADSIPQDCTSIVQAHGPTAAPHVQGVQLALWRVQCAWCLRWRQNSEGISSRTCLSLRAHVQGVTVETNAIARHDTQAAIDSRHHRLAHRTGKTKT